MSVAIVVLDSLAVPFIYEGAEPRQDLWSGEWGSPEIAIHLAVPEGLDPQCITAVKDPETGEVTLQQDPSKVQAKTAQAWQTLRAQRNALLAASDWTRLDDTSLTETQREAWRDYRQALRDVTKGLEDPANVQWPQVPN